MARKKKDEKLTTRQRQSQRIMREKSARKRRKVLLRRFQIAGFVLLAIGSVSGGVWIWQTGAIGRAAQAVSDGAYGLTVRAGFALETLYLDGRSRTSMEEIEQALDAKKGEPILRLSLSGMRERLEGIESVRLASVERELPGTLYVHIVEREPVALWQHKGQLTLIDDNGAVMKDADRAAYARLPLIVGEDAPKHVTELLEILGSEPALAKRFVAAVRVGGRRWNIRLDHDVEIRLPETQPLEAWRHLAELQNSRQLLDRDVKVIDLRLADRLFITVPPVRPGRIENAKET